MSQEYRKKPVIRIAGFYLDPNDQSLWRANEGGIAGDKQSRVDLPPKTFRVLLYLSEHAGNIVSSASLLDAVWPDSFVQPEVLRSHIAIIRRTLGDNADASRIVETVRGRGYRLFAESRALDAGGKPHEGACEVFVGRAHEEDMLRLAQRHAGAGVRQIAFVAGEAGIGKTALISRLLAPDSADGHRSVIGQCVEGYGGIEPFYPVLEALGRLCQGAGGEEVLRLLVAVAPTWAVLMPACFSPSQRSALRDDVVGAGPDRMIREGCALIEAIASIRSLLIVFDDMQWADFATIDLLTALAQRNSPARLMVICSYRIEYAEASQHAVLQLASRLAIQRSCILLRLMPLGADAIGQWLTAGKAATPADQEFADLLVERSGGNPLFLHALLDHLLALSLVCQHGNGWRATATAAAILSALPPNVAQTLEAHVRMLDASTQRLLEAASVAGSTFTSAVVASAAGVSRAAVEETCQTLARKRLFIRYVDIQQFPDGSTSHRFVFQHALIRQVLYERQGIARRSHSHRGIAEQLVQFFPVAQRDQIASELCHHFADAGLWEDALDHLRIALRIAKERGAHRDAMALLIQSDVLIAELPHAKQARSRVEYGEIRAELLAAAHDPLAVAAYRDLVEAAARINDVDSRLRALLGLSYVLSWASQKPAMDCLDDALLLAESHPDPGVSALTKIRCYTRRIWTVGWHVEDDLCCRAALATLRERGDALAIARGELEYSMLEMVSSRYSAALEHVQAGYRTLLEHARDYPEFDLSRGMWMMQLGSAWAYLMLGEFHRALAQFKNGEEFYHRHGNYLAVRALEVYQGWLFVHTMDYEKILVLDQKFQQTAMGRGGEEVCQHGGNRDALLAPQRRTWKILSGLAHEGLGDFRAAALCFSEVERDMNGEPIMLDWYWRLALDWGVSGLAVATGSHGEGVRSAGQFLERALSTDEKVWHALAWERMAQVSLLGGHHDDALAHLDAAFEATSGFDTPLADWRLHRTLAVVQLARGDTVASTQARGRYAECRIRLSRSISREKEVGIRLSVLDVGELF